MFVKHRYERGQTLPFWAIGIVAFLALLFFTINYANVVRWNIRAQNAADSAASAGIATDANIHNELNTLLYAATVDETRMRFLLQGAINTVNDPAGCLSRSNCASIYNKDVAAFGVAAQMYKDLKLQWQQANNLTRGGLQNATQGIALIGTNCTILDCAFTYTTSIDTANEIVDVVACKNVSIVAPSIIGLSSLTTFGAVGRSATTQVGIPEAFTPGVSINPNTGAVFQIDESPGLAGSEFGVTYKTLTVNFQWFTSGPTHPKAFSGSYGCS